MYDDIVLPQYVHVGTKENDNHGTLIHVQCRCQNTTFIAAIGFSLKKYLQNFKTTILVEIPTTFYFKALAKEKFEINLHLRNEHS